MDLKKYKKPFITLYVALLVFSFFFVRYSLNNPSIKVSEKQPEEKTEKIEIVNVELSIPYFNKTYKAKLKNNESVSSLLEEIRTDNDQYFYYEKTMYIYGLEICCVNDSGLKWRVIYNGEDITQKLEDVYLEEDGVYILEPIRTSVPQ